MLCELNGAGVMCRVQYTALFLSRTPFCMVLAQCTAHGGCATSCTCCPLWSHGLSAKRVVQQTLSSMATCSKWGMKVHNSRACLQEDITPIKANAAKDVTKVRAKPQQTQLYSSGSACIACTQQTVTADMHCRWLGTPKLVRDTSRRWFWQRGASTTKSSAEVKKDFSDIVLPGQMHDHVRALAAVTANTKSHGAPFRHMLFYGYVCSPIFPSCLSKLCCSTYKCVAQTNILICVCCEYPSMHLCVACHPNKEKTRPKSAWHSTAQHTHQARSPANQAMTASLGVRSANSVFCKSCPTRKHCYALQATRNW